jgi:hypothetical protein
MWFGNGKLGLEGNDGERNMWIAKRFADEVLELLWIKGMAKIPNKEESKKNKFP